jgi:hypothetical protein
MFDFGVLDAVLHSVPAADVLVAHAGRLLDGAVPSTESDVRTLLQQGCGIVVRHAERHDARLAELAQSFVDDLPGHVQVDLHATPAGAETFGWRFDLEEAFIAQTKGVADHYFRPNTVLREPNRDGSDFSGVRQESSPLFTSRLIGGDWLYVPARWWHRVHCMEDALSISIGVVPYRSRSTLPVRRSSQGGGVIGRSLGRAPGRHTEAICPAPQRARSRSSTVARKRWRI